MLFSLLLSLLSFFTGKSETASAKGLIIKPSTVSLQPSTKTGFTVLELFTSEGCSSCPSADEALLELAQEPNVYVLGYHVTYWNRLGWKDAYSQKNFDERQYGYSARLKGDGVYTPQVVINGVQDCVGSKKQYIQNQIAAEQKKTPTVQLEVKAVVQNNTDVKIEWSQKGASTTTEISFAVVEADVASKVLKGENSGRFLKHVNVVRDIITQKIGSANSGKVELFLLKNWDPKKLKIIAFTQEANLGAITCAASVNL